MMVEGSDRLPASPVVVKRPRFGRWAFWTLALLSLGIGLYAMAYLGPRAPPPSVRDNTAGLATLAVHAVGAAVALMLGPWQFLASVRTRHRRLHRWIGRLYCIACLIGGVTGEALAFGVTSGLTAQIGFGLLASCWLGATALGWASAVTADFSRHRVWMVRSFALAFAAVTLRLYLGVAMASGLSFAVAYPVIAWACWVPNLVVAELWLRRQGRVALP
jgi:hypothetical protein